MITLLATASAPRPARAQNPIDLPFDYARVKFHEWRLDRDRGRLQADLDQGNAVAVTEDLQRVRKDERRVETDRWWMRGNLFFPLAFTTHPAHIPPVPENPALIPVPEYPGYGYFPSDPTHLYRLPPASAAPPAVPAPVAVQIVNAGRPGTAVDYAVDGALYRIEGGRRQALAVAPRSTISYERGGGLGPQRYSLSAGVYEFRPVDSGWALFKVRGDGAGPTGSVQARPAGVGTR